MKTTQIFDNTELNASYQVRMTDTLARINLSHEDKHILLMPHVSGNDCRDYVILRNININVSTCLSTGIA